MEVSGENHVSVALLLGQEPQYPLNRSLGGPQNQSGLSGEQTNFFSLLGYKPRIIQSGA